MNGLGLKAKKIESYINNSSNINIDEYITEKFIDTDGRSLDIWFDWMELN